MDKRRYFEDLADRWDDLPAPPEAARHLAHLAGRVSPDGAAAVLDVGCGTGVLVPHLRRALSPAVHLVELDFAHGMLRESVRKHGAAGVAAVCADARRLPFPDGRFGAVVCFSVLPHLGDPRGVLPELVRVLAPSGTLTVAHLSASAELNAFHADLGGPVAGDVLPAAPVLAALLGDLGLRAVAVEESTGWYFVQAVRGSR